MNQDAKPAPRNSPKSRRETPADTILRFAEDCEESAGTIMSSPPFRRRDLLIQQVVSAFCLAVCGLAGAALGDLRTAVLAAIAGGIAGGVLTCVAQIVLNLVRSTRS